MRNTMNLQIYDVSSGKRDSIGGISVIRYMLKWVVCVVLGYFLIKLCKDMDIHNRSLYLQYLLINICEISSKLRGLKLAVIIHPCYWNSGNFTSSVNYKESRIFIPSQVIQYQNICAAINIADEKNLLVELKKSVRWNYACNFYLKKQKRLLLYNSRRMELEETTASNQK